jgi:ankyrin repeat protein
MAIEELVTIATEMITPFLHDTRYSDPRDCMPQVQLRVDELRYFADRLESRALKLGAGPGISQAQSALRSTRFAKCATWTGNQIALEIEYQKTTSWDTPDYPGLTHVLQTKLFRDQPHLLTNKAEYFLFYRESFLTAVGVLFGHLQMQAPTSLKRSQLFVPSVFASIPVIASRLRERNIPDCLGRSVSHILYDSKSLKNWTSEDMDTTDRLGRTSLYLACRGGSHRRVEQLVQAHVDPNVQAANGLYPLDIAAISGDLKIFTTVWKMEIDSHRLSSEMKPLVSVDNRYDSTLGDLRRSPMMWAAFFGHDHIVRLLRNYRETYPNTTALEDGSLCNAIGLAAMRGHSNVIAYLLESKCPCDLVDLNGRSPLWYAANGGHVHVVELLLRQPIFLDRRDNDGFTPLAIAAYKGHSEVVDRLRKIVDVSTLTNKGYTPLSLAASARHRECVKLLLRPSADALGTAIVWNIFSMARMNGYHEICTVFQDYDQAFTTSEFHYG